MKKISEKKWKKIWNKNFIKKIRKIKKIKRKFEKNGKKFGNKEFRTSILENFGKKKKIFNIFLRF